MKMSCKKNKSSKEDKRVVRQLGDDSSIQVVLLTAKIYALAQRMANYAHNGWQITQEN